LLNPAIGLLFAIAFLLLWLNRRERYVAYAAIAYLWTTLAFLILDVGPALPMHVERLPANIALLMMGIFYAAAFIGRFALPIPWRAMTATAVVSAAVFTWFLFVDPDIGGRIQSISIGTGLIALMIVKALWRVEKTSLIDKALFAIAALSAINLIFRPAIILAFSGDFSSYAEFQQSIYWATVQLNQAILSVAAALCLMVAVALDIIAELREQADGDNLSGLLNRRGFEAKAGAALRRCADEGQSVALLIADLDHFKQVNDVHGHAVGDAIIAAFGTLVRRTGPADMVAGRIGGEEFALLLPGASIDAARRFADAVRTGLAPACADRIPPALTPTASIGLAVGSPTEGLSQLLRQADQALYDAKRAGRNSIRSFSPAPIWLANSA
jgi:diguanylate cyclase (GGDEF)-like protein